MSTPSIPFTNKRAFPLANQYMKTHTVTPEIAKEWLDKNDPRNRVVKPNLVRALADSMRAGRWKINGDTIKFNRHGVLIDGQHRLHACIAANVPFETFVAHDLDEDVIFLIDVGAKRPPSDILYMSGEINTVVLASSLRTMIEYAETGSIGIDRKRVMPEKLKRTLDMHPGIRKSASFIAGKHSLRNVFPSVVTALHYIMSRIDEEFARVFFEYLATGNMLSQDSPVYLLREIIMGRKIPKDSHGGRRYLAALLIKAFNAERAGKKMSRLYWQEGREGFPVLDGAENFLW